MASGGSKSVGGVHGHGWMALPFCQWPMCAQERARHEPVVTVQPVQVADSVASARPASFQKRRNVHACCLPLARLRYSSAACCCLPLLLSEQCLLMDGSWWLGVSSFLSPFRKASSSSVQLFPSKPLTRRQEKPCSGRETAQWVYAIAGSNHGLF